jgi:hypothetical protein
MWGGKDVRPVVGAGFFVLFFFALGARGFLALEFWLQRMMPLSFI